MERRLERRVALGIHDPSTVNEKKGIVGTVVWFGVASDAILHLLPPMLPAMQWK